MDLRGSAPPEIRMSCSRGAFPSSGIGVSRCGKTPTALYLALQFGIRAANFPLTPDDFAACLDAAVAGVQARGKAEAGDKTMIDALLPAGAALRAALLLAGG